MMISTKVVYGDPWNFKDVSVELVVVAGKVKV